MGNRLCYQKGEFAMKRFLCKGQLEEQLTNFMIDVDNCFIIVKNVPSQVCSQCGEVPTRWPPSWSAL